MRLTPALAILSLAVLGVAAGCGGSSSSSTPTTTTAAAAPGSAGTTLKLEAASNGALEFDKKTLDAPAGKVMIVMTNPSSVPHDIAVEGNGVDLTGKTVTGGATSTVSANLKPGTYTFYCSVPGHEDAGMKGTLTVK